MNLKKEGSKKAMHSEAVGYEDIKKLPHYQYIGKIAQIMHLNSFDKNIYSLDAERIKYHKEILRYHGYNPEDNEIYLRSKRVFDHLDRICKLLSDINVAKLETEGDILFCANYLYEFCQDLRFRWWMQSKISWDRIWMI